jgi:hypothetical protein
MRLPNFDRAVVNIAKLREYSLNPRHDVGKHKAWVFKSALGITIDDADWLQETILELVGTCAAITGKPSPFGSKYIVDMLIERKRQSAIVRTTWIIDFGTDFPRLTSCYVL